MSTRIELKKTADLSLFVAHELNRPLHKDPMLLSSMKEHGFMPSSPLQCIRGANGKLKVIRGHHRLECAKQLGIPVYYVVDTTNTDLFELEGNSKPRWSLKDFVFAYANKGDKDYLDLLEFSRENGLEIGVAATLLSGFAGASHMLAMIKKGLFIVRNLSGAQRVVAISNAAYEHGITFAKTASFVRALSMIVALPEFNDSLFIERVRRYPYLIKKRNDRDNYLDEIEYLYNYKTRQDYRIAIAFRARYEASQKSEATRFTTKLKASAAKSKSNGKK